MAGDTAENGYFGSPCSSDIDNYTREKLMVVVRVKPPENSNHSQCLFVLDDKTLILDDGLKSGKDGRRSGVVEKKYKFDHVFGPHAKQRDLYEITAKTLVRDLLVGYNGAIFAYGATGSGKTYTMIGCDGSEGVMVRAIRDLFQLIRGQTQQYEVSISYFEIYNENIKDLLNSKSGYLDLRDDHNSIRVVGLTEITADSSDEATSLLEKGNRYRTVEKTAVNKVSSRSHALFSVTVRQKYDPDDKPLTKAQIKQGRLFLIDLAGCERVTRAQTRGKRLEEGGHINRSLLALSNCIKALSSSNGSNAYVNYRDSKLTRLLREPLSGNSRTVMIATASAEAQHREETKNTLGYACQASRITNRVERNVVDVSFHASQYRSIISDLRKEVARLKSKLDRNGASPIWENGACSTRDGNGMKRIKREIVETFELQMKLRKQLMDIDSRVATLDLEADKQREIIDRNLSSNSFQIYAPSKYGNSKTDDLTRCWEELDRLEKEQKQLAEMRKLTLAQLEELKRKAHDVENNLLSLLDSETERELLKLLCRVHELEADKLALLEERLLETHAMNKQNQLVETLSRQQKLSDDIITRQRKLIDGKPTYHDVT